VDALPAGWPTAADIYRLGLPEAIEAQVQAYAKVNLIVEPMVGRSNRPLRTPGDVFRLRHLRRIIAILSGEEGISPDAHHLDLEMGPDDADLVWPVDPNWPAAMARFLESDPYNEARYVEWATEAAQADSALGERVDALTEMFVAAGANVEDDLDELSTYPIDVHKLPEEDGVTEVLGWVTDQMRHDMGGQVHGYAAYMHAALVDDGGLMPLPGYLVEDEHPELSVWCVARGMEDEVIEWLRGVPTPWSSPAEALLDQLRRLRVTAIRDRAVPVYQLDRLWGRLSLFAVD